MKKVQVTDEWLCRYMPVVDDAIIREVESKVSHDYVFTERFEQRMKKVCRREKYAKGLLFLQKMGKRVAMIVLLLLASFLTVTMSVEAYRILFFESIRKLEGDMFRYTYHVEEETEFVKREPSYIPEGYELVSDESGDNLLFLVYQKESGEQLFFIQEKVTDTLVSYHDAEYDWVEQYTIAGSQLEIYRYVENDASAYFEYGGSVYSIGAYEYMSGEEFCRMIREWIK